MQWLGRIVCVNHLDLGAIGPNDLVFLIHGDGDILKRASLLRRDSVHGAFTGTISVDEENEVIWANGTKILTCGTCLDFYGIKDKLAVGGVTNLYAIAEIISKQPGAMVL